MKTPGRSHGNGSRSYARFDVGQAQHQRGSTIGYSFGGVSRRGKVWEMSIAVEIAITVLGGCIYAVGMGVKTAGDWIAKGGMALIDLAIKRAMG